MSLHQTQYGKAMEQEEPENEEEILEYYVTKAQENLESYDDAEYFDVTESDKRLFFKMIDMWIIDVGETRRGHREFIQVTMNNVERFNVQDEPKAYLKILECYPQSIHTGIRRNKWFKAVWQDKMLDHEIAVRLFGIMSKNNAYPDDKFYNTCVRLFGHYSRATAAIRSLLFWSPRLASFDPFYVTPKHLATMDMVEIAFRGLRQASPGLDTIYQRFEVDKMNLEGSHVSRKNLDCILSVQSEDQIELLSKHDVSQPIHVEGPFSLYFKNKKIQYYVMRGDPVINVTPKKVTKILTDKEWWMEFYKKDFESSRPLKETGEIYSKECFFPYVEMEDGLSELDQKTEEIVQVLNDTRMVEGPVYAIAATDFNSPNALRTWVKGLQPTNPVLSQATVVFHKVNAFLCDGYKSLQQNGDDE